MAIGPRPMRLAVGPFTVDSWDAVRRIYLEGIATGNATFETTAPSWEVWDRGHLPHGRLAAHDQGQIVGWAALSAVSARKAYAGVAEVSLYVAAASRGRGVGKALIDALIDSAERAGLWTLQGSVFPENSASRALLRSRGFREVGLRERIGQLHGVWRDTILMERRSATVGV